MKAITIIQAEHRNLAAVLGCLQILLRDVAAEKQAPDFFLFHAILHYVDSFLDRFHHPKEDEYLFPALCACHPEAKDLIRTLQSEHGEGTQTMTKLKDEFADYESSGLHGFTRFRQTAEDYIDQQRQHVAKEERQLLPLARRYLKAEDWVPIDAKFSENEDPMFGKKPAGQYAQLSQLILDTSLFGKPIL
jgi:branched-chain amino acid transport system ATP-binding protein